MGPSLPQWLSSLLKDESGGGGQPGAAYDTRGQYPRPREPETEELTDSRLGYAAGQNLMIPSPQHTNHQLCIEEVFQGIDTLKNQTAQGDAVKKIFQNLSLIKEYIDLQKRKCGGERWRVKQFLDYLQVFLGVINTEWTMES